MEIVLRKLAQLPQIRCAFVDPFLCPQGYGEQCRILREGDEWVIEFVRERRGTVHDFFADMDVAVAVQEGFQVVQGRNRYGGVREIGPNVQGWYTAEQWAFVECELKIFRKK